MSTISKQNQIVEIANQDSRLAAYVELTKLRISVMVLVTFVVAAILAGGGTLSIPVLLSAMVGMLAIAASGNAMNMYVERYSDFLMKRTQTVHYPIKDCQPPKSQRLVRSALELVLHSCLRQ